MAQDKFFLAGIAETATSSRLTFERITGLRREAEQKLSELGRRARAGQQLLKKLYSQPIMNARQIAEAVNISYPAASALAKSFETLGILREVTGHKRNRLFVFSDYLRLFTSSSART